MKTGFQHCFRQERTLPAGLYLALFKAVTLTATQDQQVLHVLVYSVPPCVLPEPLLSTAKHKQILPSEEEAGKTVRV